MRQINVLIYKLITKHMYDDYIVINLQNTSIIIYYKKKIKINKNNK